MHFTKFISSVMYMLCTVEPLNNGHIEGKHYVHCRVVPISESRKENGRFHCRS